MRSPPTGIAKLSGVFVYECAIQTQLELIKHDLIENQMSHKAHEECIYKPSHLGPISWRCFLLNSALTIQIPRLRASGEFLR